MDTKKMARILTALANENRLKIFIMSKKTVTTEELMKKFRFEIKTQSGLLKHLKILEGEALIIKERGKSTITENGLIMLDLLESYEKKTEKYREDFARGKIREFVEGYGFTISKDDLIKLLKKKK
jgi:DNA-binding transcriptional ArsR family regulator